MCIVILQLKGVISKGVCDYIGVVEVETFDTIVQPRKVLRAMFHGESR
jgi:hypothetical protein